MSVSSTNLAPHIRLKNCTSTLRILSFPTKLFSTNGTTSGKLNLHNTILSEKCRTLGLSGVRSMLGVCAGMGMTMSSPGRWQPGHQTLGCFRVRPQAVIQVDCAVRLRMRISWEPSQPPRSPGWGGGSRHRMEGTGARINNKNSNQALPYRSQP